MAYYVVLNFDIDDPTKFREYEQQVGATLSPEMKVLIFDREANDLEGSSRQRLVVLEFETEAGAMRWYRSPAYQHVSLLRKASSTGWVRGAPQYSKGSP